MNGRLMRQPQGYAVCVRCSRTIIPTRFRGIHIFKRRAVGATFPTPVIFSIFFAASAEFLLGQRAKRQKSAAVGAVTRLAEPRAEAE
jgi:hypothetical protein